ncbi:MAG TPA: HAD-IIIA family hydrolase [Xanthobacteraceae bacterium]|nr:HAD-IIIA family hydrolase [Xanthobacteraceae bacterium]
MHAVIIAGGLGTRAHAMTGDRIPKALLPVAGVPIVFRQMRVLRREGVERLTVLAGHLGDQLGGPLGEEARALGLALDVLIETEPLGTAGCLAALAPAAEDALLVSGDMLFDIALAPLVAFHRQQDALITVVAHPNDHPRTSDLVRTRDGLVTAVLPRDAARERDERNLVPAGIYLASAGFFARIPAGEKRDMVHELLPRLVAAGERVAAYNTPEYIRDVGSAGRHAAAERDLAVGIVAARNLRNTRPAIFFDVDGVLNEEPGTQGALRADDVRLVAGAGTAVAAARGGGFLTVAITNRPQVARGDITFDELDAILGRLEALLAEDGGILDRIYVCPHHPDGGFAGEVAALKIRCECRKPGALLFRRAMQELPIERARSIAIGDSLRDIGAARAAGVWAYGVRTGYGCRDTGRYPGGAAAAPTPDLMFDDVGDAVRFALGYQALAAPLMRAARERSPRRPPVIGICGRSRAGKSVAAHALTRALTEAGETPLLVRLDDWIMPAAERKPDDTAEIRNRVHRLPGILAALREGKAVTAPGYDPATRTQGPPVTYDAADRSYIVLDGVFAGHRSIRPLVDCAAFVDASDAVQRKRFAAHYRWKGFDDAAMEELWRVRMADEWAAVDAQREHCNVTIKPDANEP